MNKNMIKQGLLLICVVLFLVSVSQVVTILYRYEQGRMAYQKLEESAGIEKKEEEKIDFQRLAEINEEVIGWLIVDGTDISYPIVQHEDNAYYLNHLFTGEEHPAGSIFLDATNSADFSDQNSILYGHNMKDGSMFGQLDKFQEETFFHQYPSFRLLTPEKTYRVEVFSAYTALTQDEIWKKTFGENEFYNWTGKIANHSIIQTDIQFQENDRIMTLATCSEGGNDKRFVLVGKVAEVI